MRRARSDLSPELVADGRRPESGGSPRSGRAAALLERLVPLRPPPARNAYFAYGVAVAYLRASGEGIDDSFEPWRDLITEIRALRLTVYDIADRLCSSRSTG